MSSHIFLICSPLQLRIATTIKKQLTDGTCHAIYLKTNKNIMRGVKKELEHNFDSHLIARMDYDIVNLIAINNYMKKSVSDPVTVHLANAGELPLHYIVSLLGANISIKTFDDGILNLNSLESIQEIDNRMKERSKLRYKLSRLFFKKIYNTQKIVDSTILHYTILNENKKYNVKSKVVKLELFRKESEHIETTKKTKNNKIVNIFVGSRFKDILRTKNAENLESLLTKINNINSKYDNIIYLRHPRELSKNAFHMEERCIDTISEDYIYKLANENNMLNIIGFGSTCQLNVMDIPNVKITLLQTKLIRDDIINSFSLFKKSNVTIYDID
ncbi:glycosyltransferase family 52 [Providencia stuartii]